jgi:hypothetical protein
MNDVVDMSDRTLQEKVKDFSLLLQQIDMVDDKKKQLWKEIYENAICDRQNAYVMFVKLVTIVQDKSTEHAIHGKSLSSYIDRMSKANDQLIKLAELLQKSDRSDGPIDPDDVFDQIKEH